MNYNHIQRIWYVEISKILHKIWEGRYFYFDLDVTLTLMCDLELIDDL